MKRMRRIIASVITFATVLSLLATALCLPTSAKDVSVLNGTGTRGAYSITGPFGYRLNIASPFTGFGYCMPTWTTTDSSCTLSIYKWTGTFTDTMATEPIASKHFENMRDNATNWVTFDEQPAGNYLFTITEPQGSVGVWMHSEPVNPYGYLYLNNIEQEGDPELYIRFPGNVTDPFAECPPAEDAVDGNHTSPPEAELPADSLINTHPVMPDTWVFTDGLGRKSLTNADVGDPRDDKTVSMFYWTWHINFKGSNCYNNNEVLKNNPDAINDYDHPVWSTVSGQLFWNEPIWGYYANDDAWVVRRQGEMLANAGVDAVLTDNTNGTFTWQSAYTAVLEAWAEAKADGVNTPKMSFMLPFAGGSDTATQLRSLYTDIYRNNKFQDQWFYWDGKPVIMAHGTTSGLSINDPMEKEILNFFTYRAGYPSYTNPASKRQFGSWGWLSITPQAVYYGTRENYQNKTPEMTTVGVAMNHSYSQHMIAAMNGKDIMGRSYTTDYEDRYKKEGDEASKWGYNFAEQWENALETDPQMIFVTGWNEWTAGRYLSWPEGLASAVENANPDQCNDEFSRDIEPTKGDLQDHYYYQLVNYVRKYKGARPIPTPSEKVTVDIQADNSQWNNIAPYYASYIGNTDDRDAIGYAGIRYTEYSGRNDIIGSRVARDDENLYFYVECNEDITPYTDPLWMNLYIDANQDNQGWNTFDFILNKTAPTADKATLERFTGDGYTTEKVGEVDYTVSGKYMQVKIPKSMLGLDGYDFTVNFAWTDNVHDADDAAEAEDADYVYTKFSGDIMDFYTSGDVAPGGRFKFSYISTSENAGIPVETDTESESATESDSVSESAADTTDTTVGTDATDTTADDADGCASTLGAAAVLVAGAAAMVLLKKKDEDI